MNFTDPYGQPVLRPDKPRVVVTVNTKTIAELAHRAIELATPALGADNGPYAAAIIEPGPRLKTSNGLGATAPYVEATLEVGTADVR